MSLWFICLASLFFLHPSFSTSCQLLPQPYELPCNKSIQIKPPFFLKDDMRDFCGTAINIKCGDPDVSPQIYLFHSKKAWFYLEKIIYAPSPDSPIKLIVHDPEVENNLSSSSCGDLLFSFKTQLFQYDQYRLIGNNITSFCRSPELSDQRLILDRKYNLSYSARTDEHLPTNCYRKVPNAYFEWIFSFDKDGNVFLLSARYSYKIICSKQSIIGGNCGDECDGREGKMDTIKKREILIIGTAAGFLAFIITCLILIVKLRTRKNSAKCILSSKYSERNIEMLLEKCGSSSPKRYKYGEVKIITNSFQNILGRGGFGTVYKGRLPDGRLVAVKILHRWSNHGEEFLNEVLSIGRTSHVNVVTLLGFCIEGSNRALIYEYMPNGSLENYIYFENSKSVLGLETLYLIAIGIARGLEYLHRGCNTRIVHFDIKPQNILLDEDFNPKIADFGLAKLCPPKESILSMAEMRGTIGYIAPEVFSRIFGVVSAKSDVYSYGMMVLEMVGGRRNAKPSAENESQVFFPHWLYDRLAEDRQIQASDVSIENEEIAKKMGIVGLWCTQTIPANRPSMSRVVEMLEKGLDELEMPPKPFSFSPPHSTLLSVDNSSTSIR